MIKIETDPERLRPIDADLQLPDTSKFQDPQLETWGGFEKTMLIFKLLERQAL